MSETGQPKKRRRGRRWAIALAVLACAVAGTWVVAERLINVDRYRPMAAALIEQTVGLPAEIERLDLALLPSPRVVAHGVTVGEGDLRASVQQVGAVIRPKALLKRQVDVATVTLSELTVTAPKEPGQLLERLRELRFATPSAGASTGLGLSLNVALVRARGAKLFLDGATEPVLVFDVEAEDVLSGAIPVRLSAAPKGLGDGAGLECALTVEPSAGPAVRGSVELHDVDLRALLNRPWVPAARADVKATLDGSNLDRIAADVTGAVSFPETASLSGTFTADAWWDSGSVVVNNIAWQAPGMTLTGDVTRKPNGQMACRIGEAVIQGEATALAAAFLPERGVALTTEDAAEIQVHDVLAGTTEDGPWRLASGEAAFSGFGARLSDGTGVFAGLSGDASLEEGVVRLSRFEAEGVSLTGTLTPDFALGQVAVELDGAATVPARLGGLFFQSDAVQELAGTVTISRVSGTFGAAGGLPDDLAVDATVEDGLLRAALSPLGQPLTVSQISGNVGFRDGILSVSGLKGDGFSVAEGTVKPDWAGNRYAVELRGSVQLEHPQVTALLPTGMVEDLRGAVAVDRLSGTFEPGKGLPADLVAEGSLKEIQASLTTSAYADRFTSGAGHFTARPEAIEVDVRAESAKLGPVACAGAYTFASRMWHGSVSCDVARAAAAVLTSPAQQAWAAPALEAYRDAAFDVDLGLSPPPVERVTVKAARRGSPKLDASVEFLLRQGQWGLGAVDATGEIPAGVATALLRPAIQAAGTATVGFRRAAGEPTFLVQADLAACSIGLGPYLRKRLGDPLSIQVDGRATPGRGWKPGAVSVAYGGMTVPLVIEGDRFLAKDLDLDLRRLTGLLPEGAAAQGRLRGLVATNPRALDLQFDQAAFALSPELAIDAITGDLAYADGQWTCRDLALRGANSDFRVTGALLEGQWRGRLSGKQVDLNALQAMMKAIPSAPKQEEDVTASGFQPPEGLTGELDVEVGTLFFRRGRLDQVQAHVSADRQAIRVRDLRCRPYTGAATGWVELTELWPPPGGRMRFDLELDSVDARILDEIVFTDPRHFRGTLSGRAQFDVPMGDTKQTLAGATGRAVFAAEKGSFGKLGFTTKLLTVLRATEVFRLRAPSLKDEGLTYDTCHGSLSMQDGFMTLEGVRLARPSYTMEGAGTIDFPHDATTVDVRVTFLEGMRGIMQHVPVLGEAAAKVTGLMLTVRGSPYDPVIRGQRMQRTGEQVNQTEEATVEIIQDLLEGFLNR